MSRLVGLCGYAGAGKDTVADYLVRAHGYRKISFADPIRNMLGALLVSAGVERAWLTDRALKELPIPGLDKSYRELAQTLGTEWGRSLDNEFWLKIAQSKVRCAPADSKFVVSDVRFHNEAAWVRQAGGVLFCVQRGVPPVRPHASEELAHKLGGLSLHNDGTIAALEEHLYWLVQRGVLP